MSQERFNWLKSVAGEVIATPGCESNVKEIFDKCHELDATRGSHIVIFNQFEQFENYLWHYEVTGRAILEVLENLGIKADNVRAYASSTGSGGTLAAGDHLKDVYPGIRIGAGEALQCPTLLRNGFGAHRIEGIGDKHVPWIHNVKNTDMVLSIDDQDCMDIYRLFNEPAGKDYLSSIGVKDEDIGNLELFGISGIGNMLSAIKMAKSSPTAARCTPAALRSSHSSRVPSTPWRRRRSMRRVCCIRASTTPWSWATTTGFAYTT